MRDQSPFFELPLDDAIVAIATPAGRGALGIVRISGDKAIEISSKISGNPQKIFSANGGMSLVSRLCLPDLAVDAVFTVWRAPRSFTGQDSVEITVHGSPLLLLSVENYLVKSGARPAQPGEFTFRAIMNGKISPDKAGAISALINAHGKIAMKSAMRTLRGEFLNRIKSVIAQIEEIEIGLTAEIEFPEAIGEQDESIIISRIEKIEKEIDKLYSELKAGEKLSRPQTIVIVGPPNVGKSTLFNALLEMERSIVHETPGTTRDFIEAELNIFGVPTTLVDTAGIRETPDGIEIIGVRKARKKIDEADLIILVLDVSAKLDDDARTSISLTKNIPRIIVMNKADKGVREGFLGDIHISAKKREGIDELKKIISGKILDETIEPLWASSWQIEKIKSAQDAIIHALDASRKSAMDATSEELAFAKKALGESIGESSARDLIEKVLENFCLGK